MPNSDNGRPHKRKYVVEQEDSSEPSANKIPYLLPNFFNDSPPLSLPADHQPTLLYNQLIVSTIPKYWKNAYNLGSGHFGNIHLVHSDKIDPSGQKIIHNEFVIKLVKYENGKLPSIVREVELHRKCRFHENVLSIGLCYCQQDDDGYRVQICLEYAALGDFHLLSTKDKSEKHVGYVLEGLLRGLEHVHSCDVIHGDISIRNVLMTHTGIVKLADFGASRTIENATKKFRRFPGGTPGFIAPEVVKKVEYGTKADIFSAASFVMYLMKGINPFRQGIQFDLEIYFKLIKEDYKYTIPDDFSDDLKNFLESMYSYDPSERKTATELLSHKFLQHNVTPREMTDFYKEMRDSNGKDFPYPDDVDPEHPFHVPVEME